jgi:hypothetical protein
VNDATLRRLPGSPGPRLTAIWEALTEEERAALAQHLLQGTPAEVLAELLHAFGHPISASTIRTYRRALRREASV